MHVCALYQRRVSCYYILSSMPVAGESSGEEVVVGEWGLVLGWKSLNFHEHEWQRQQAVRCLVDVICTKVLCSHFPLFSNFPLLPHHDVSETRIQGDLLLLTQAGGGWIRSWWKMNIISFYSLFNVVHIFIYVCMRLVKVIPFYCLVHRIFTYTRIA